MSRLPLVLLALGACTGMQDPSTVEQADGACFELEGRTFASVDELECGLTPDGVARCHWSVTFTARDTQSTDFLWSYSDVGEAGSVSCLGDVLTATTGARTVHATYDPAAQTLSWAGQTYVAQ